MTPFAPPNKYVWDAWFVLDPSGKTLHAFYLQAPRSLPAGKRHLHASIGHATADYPTLKKWNNAGIALRPSSSPAVDDQALWTGSIYRWTDRYYMVYTGLSKSSGWTQRVCLATSPDLYTWTKYDNNPVLEADWKYYHMQDTQTDGGEIFAFRDPYLFEDNGNVYMLISANIRAKTPYNGCIAIARMLSGDLTKWQLLPPLCAPGMYKEMEVPQLIYYQKKYYIFFSVWPEKINPSYTGTQGNLQCFVSDTLFGEYAPIPTTSPFDVYAIRLIDHQKNVFRCMGWLTEDENKKFLGGFSQAFYLTICEDKISHENC